MKELTKVQTSLVIGGATKARCDRMIDRWIRNGGDRLGRRILKNCGQYYE